MKLREFRHKMEKKIFTFAEAQVLLFTENKLTLKANLHNWVKQGELVALKRGLFMFADYRALDAEIAKALYHPCYISLEYILSSYSIIPEAVFTVTLVTTKAGRKFATPRGTFNYRKIKQAAFVGYDVETLMASKEKALVDYFYLNKSRLVPEFNFWEQMRFEPEILKDIDFRQVFAFAELFESGKLILLLKNLEAYANA